MEIIAVVVGYLLGITPFIVPKIVEKITETRNYKYEQKEEAEQKEIYDEWLNGVKTFDTKQEGKVDFLTKESLYNQQDIYNEYITGKVVKGD